MKKPIKRVTIDNAFSRASLLDRVNTAVIARTIKVTTIATTVYTTDAAVKSPRNISLFFVYGISNRARYKRERKKEEDQIFT